MKSIRETYGKVLNWKLTTFWKLPEYALYLDKEILATARSGPRSYMYSMESADGKWLCDLDGSVWRERYALWTVPSQKKVLQFKSEWGGFKHPFGMGAVVLSSGINLQWIASGFSTSTLFSMDGSKLASFDAAGSRDFPGVGGKISVESTAAAIHEFPFALLFVWYYTFIRVPRGADTVGLISTAASRLQK